jgi:hypothetical protein
MLTDLTPRFTLFPAIACLLFTACGDAGSAPVTPTATIAHGSTALTVEPGGSGNVEFAIVRNDGHSATIHFTVDNVPLGVVAQFSPASVSGSAVATTLAVTVGFLTPTGSYTLQARVTGEGVSDKTIPVTIAVVQPGIALTIEQSAASVEQQKSVTVPVTVSRRDGYAGTVGLTVVGLPAGVSAAFEPTTLLPDQTTSTLTFTAALSASIASSPVTIRATGAGVIHATSPFEVTITHTTTPGILLVSNPALVQLRAGETADASIEIRRFAGYQGALNFELSVAPAGITASFTPSESDPNIMVMRVSAAADATLGNKLITFRATGSGISSAESQVTAQVISHPTFAFAANSIVTFTQGTTATNGLNVQVNRIGGFSEPIRLTAEGVPAGVSITPDVNDFEIPGSGSSGLFTYVAAADAAPGPQSFTVRGVSTVTGKTASVVVPLVVRARGSYSLSASETTITMPTGTNRIIDLTITRTGGFSGNISLSLLNAQLGVFSVFTPATTSGSSVRMLIGTALGTTPRTFTVSVRSTAPGADPVELPLTIIVTP